MRLCVLDLKSARARIGPACLSLLDTSSPGTDNHLLSVDELSETLITFRHSAT